MVRSYANQAQGGWLSDQVQAALPNLNRQFAENRDPLAARQLADTGKSEKQRRDEQSSGGAANDKAQSQRRKTDKPAPALKPPPHMRGQTGWLRAQQRAAFDNIPAEKARDAPQRDRPTRYQGHNQSRAPEL